MEREREREEWSVHGGRKGESKDRRRLKGEKDEGEFGPEWRLSTFRFSIAIDPYL